MLNCYLFLTYQNVAESLGIWKNHLKIIKSFGQSYDIDFKPRSGLELNIAKNWDVNNWITGNQDDGFKYDGCAAFQNVLDGKYRKYKKN